MSEARRSPAYNRYRSGTICAAGHPAGVGGLDGWIGIHSGPTLCRRLCYRQSAQRISRGPRGRSRSRNEHGILGSTIRYRGSYRTWEPPAARCNYGPHDVHRWSGAHVALFDPGFPPSTDAGLFRGWHRTGGNLVRSLQVFPDELFPEYRAGLVRRRAGVCWDDAKGSQAANIQLIIQTWPNNYFGGASPYNATVNDQLTAANTWQTFRFNLGSVQRQPNRRHVAVEFPDQCLAMGRRGPTDTLTVDNIVLARLVINVVHVVGQPGGLRRQRHLHRQGGHQRGRGRQRDGPVVFSYAGGPFSTNTVSGGSATSAALSNLPVGTDLITAAYFGGNYPASTNTLNQVVNAAFHHRHGPDQSVRLHGQPGERFSELELGGGEPGNLNPAPPFGRLLHQCHRPRQLPGAIALSRRIQYQPVTPVCVFGSMAAALAASK